MGEFYKPEPVVVEREVREVNGVLESVVTSEGNRTNSEHLRQEKEKWVEQYLFEAAQSLSWLESDEQYLAAD